MVDNFDARAILTGNWGTVTINRSTHSHINTAIAPIA